MEQCYRIALWMFLLIGYLQANPLPSPCTKGLDLKEQPFDHLKNEVQCGENVTFISPPNDMDHCEEVLNCFVKQLWYAAEKCQKVDRIYMTMDYLRAAQSPTCGKWENEGPRKQFNDFVTDLKKFTEMINAKITTSR